MSKKEAFNTLTGQSRTFSQLVWDNIPSSVDERGNAIPKGGWVERPSKENTPEAALKAAELAEKQKAEAEAKNAELLIARNKDLKISVEAKLKSGSKDFDVKNEILPYLEIIGKKEELGQKPLKDILEALNKGFLEVPKKV